MRVLVTGGAGYIGSHACKALARAGHEPIVLDNLSRGRKEAVRWGPLIEGDVRDGALLRRVMREFDVKSVMHFAALTYVGESVSDPRLYFSQNTVGSLTLLDSMLEEGVSQIVFSSTAALYGQPTHVPIREDHRCIPINPYGISKHFVEQSLEWYSQAYGLRYAALRYFNAAGADPDGELGECHDPETHIIPLALDAAAGSGQRMKIYGTDYPTPDGTALRDYVHVSDLAEAHVRALEYLERGGRSEAFNLGTGTGYSVLQVLAAVGRVTNRMVPYDAFPQRQGDPPELVAQTEKARRILNWVPQFTSLDEIIQTAWDWYRAAFYPLGTNQE